MSGCFEGEIIFSNFDVMRDICISYNKFRLMFLNQMGWYDDLDHVTLKDQIKNKQYEICKKNYV